MTHENLIVIGVPIFLLAFWIWNIRALNKRNKYKFAPFQKDDIVEAFGNIGVVQSVGQNGYLSVKFEDCESLVVFNTNGKLMKWHKNVSLKKI